MSRWPTSVMRALLALVMIAVSLVSISPAADAQRPGSLELINQRAWIRPGNLFSLTLSMQGGSGDHLISARVLPAVASRSEFQLHKEGVAGVSEPVFMLPPTPVKQVRTGPNIPAGIILEIETTNPARTGGTETEPDPSRGLIAEPGVYPVLITLADPSERQQDEILTFLVVTPSSVDGLPELLVNVTLPIQAPPALGADQTSDLDDEARERIEAAVSEIVSRPSVEVTLAAVPETIVALDRAEESDAVVADLRTAAEKRETLRLPYVSVDEEAWRKANMTQAYLRLLRAGDRVARRQLARESQSGAVYLDSTATPQTVAMLADIGYTHFVASDRLLAPLPSAQFPFTVTNQFTLVDDRGNPHPAATLDSELSRHFGANENPILDAYYFVADLAALWFDQPSTQRGVIVRPSADWDFDPSVLNVALSGIKAMPITKATTLDNFFAEVDDLSSAGQRSTATGDGVMIRELAPTDEPESLTDYRGRLQQSQGLLLSYERLFGGRTAVSAPLRELLLVSGSRTHATLDQFAYLQAVDDSIDTVRRSITGPQPQVVSITARTADIPLTIESELDTPAEVVLRFTSDKLEFPEGNTINATLEPNQITNLSVPIRSRSSGDAKLRVTVLSPDETIQLAAPTQLIVRSTVFSGLGIIILVGALIILAIWWIRQARRTRREKASAQLAA